MTMQTDIDGRSYSQSEAAEFDAVGAWAEYCHKMRASFETFQAGCDRLIDDRDYVINNGWRKLLDSIEQGR